MGRVRAQTSGAVAVEEDKLPPCRLRGCSRCPGSSGGGVATQAWGGRGGTGEAGSCGKAGRCASTSGYSVAQTCPAVLFVLSLDLGFN